MLTFPHSSQASICPPKAEVRHFFNAESVRNCQELSPKSSSLGPKTFRTSATSKPLGEEAILADIPQTKYRAVKRVFVWKVVQFGDKSTSYRYFRDRGDF